MSSRNPRGMQRYDLPDGSHISIRMGKKIMKGARGEEARRDSRERAPEWDQDRGWDEKGNSSVIGWWIWIIGWWTIGGFGGFR